MTSRAINVLIKAKQIYPQSYLIAANLGSALAQAERYSEGLPELERALALQPSSTIVLNNLAVFYARRDEYARALDFWRFAALRDRRTDHSPLVRQAQVLQCVTVTPMALCQKTPRNALFLRGSTWFSHLDIKRLRKSFALRQTCLNTPSLPSPRETRPRSRSSSE